MKPSDHPLSPFNPNYKAQLNWAKDQLAKDNGAIVTRNVNAARKRGIEPGAILIGKHPGGDLLSPRHFHIYMKAKVSK